MINTKLKIQLATILSKVIQFSYKIVGAKTNAIRAFRHKIEWQLDLKEGIDFAVFLGVYEYSTIKLYKKFIREGDIILDIGANIGSHTLPLAKECGASGRVFAFEPTAFAYAKLLKNISLNPSLASSIVAEQVALTNNDNVQPESTIYSSWPLEKTQGVHPKHLGNPKTTEGCRSITLDSYLKEKNISKVNFIKLDVDGFECTVLQGALETLKSHHPVIFMELAPYVLQERGDSLEKLIGIIKKANYQFYHLGTDRVFSMDPVVLDKLFPPGSSLNIMARATI